MSIVIRAVEAGDAGACGLICWAAFKAVSDRHGFPSPFPSVEAATRRVTAFIHHPAVFGLVAEIGDTGQIVGFAFLSERDPMRAIGPVAVDPAGQSRGAGRRLMEAVLGRARGAPGVRLLQDGFNMASLALYASLGFQAKELCIALVGVPESAPLAGWCVRAMTDGDVDACEALHQRVHGFARTNDLREALASGSPVVAVQDGRLRAYMAAPALWLANHGVADTDEAMRALILGAARVAEAPLSFLLPIRQGALLRWCLSQGLRATRPMTLMAMGEYQDPTGTFVPSVLY